MIAVKAVVYRRNCVSVIVLSVISLCVSCDMLVNAIMLYIICNYFCCSKAVTEFWWRFSLCVGWGWLSHSVRYSWSHHRWQWESWRDNDPKGWWRMVTRWYIVIFQTLCCGFSLQFCSEVAFIFSFFDSLLSTVLKSSVTVVWSKCGTWSQSSCFWMHNNIFSLIVMYINMVILFLFILFACLIVVHSTSFVFNCLQESTKDSCNHSIILFQHTGNITHYYFY